MAGHQGASAFVTGAAGFIGLELVQILAARGVRVVGLAASLDAAERVRLAGGVPVIGDLREPGRWQDEVEADWVFHLPPHWARGPRTTPARVDAFARTRVAIDASLLDAVAKSARRIVYVGDTSWYGAMGERAITEDEPPRASSWSGYMTPALDAIDGYLAAGLPIVTALPGWVYGNGSWFRERVIDPVMTGRRVLQYGRTGTWVSAIHVHDCARALIHLVERGEVGGRYFLVNSQPVRVHDFARMFARLAARPLRVLHLPHTAARLVLGPILADYIQADAVFSNIRLRGIGFQFNYPTLEQGFRQVLGVCCHE